MRGHLRPLRGGRPHRGLVRGPHAGRAHQARSESRVPELAAPASIRGRVSASTAARGSPAPQLSPQGRPRTRPVPTSIAITTCALAILRRRSKPTGSAVDVRRNRVREGGVEPPHPFGHTDLNRARLPIPPLARVPSNLTRGPRRLGREQPPHGAADGYQSAVTAERRTVMINGGGAYVHARRYDRVHRTRATPGVRCRPVRTGGGQRQPARR